MISIDVRHAANNLIAGNEHPYDLKITIASRMVEAAVDIINSPQEVNEILHPLCIIYEEEYDIVAPDLVILGIVKRIQEYMEDLGWDKRLKVKVKFKTVSKVFCMAIVRMDLDATFIERERLSLRRRKAKPPTVEVVSENPSSDELNEFFTVVDRESSSKADIRAIKSARRT